jgi:hypothetical protein
MHNTYNRNQVEKMGLYDMNRPPREMVIYEVETRSSRFGEWIITDFEREEGAAIKAYEKRLVDNTNHRNKRVSRLVKRIMIIQDEVLLSNESDIRVDMHKP